MLFLLPPRWERGSRKQSRELEERATTNTRHHLFIFLVAISIVISIESIKTSPVHRRRLDAARSSGLSTSPAPSVWPPADLANHYPAAQFLLLKRCQRCISILAATARAGPAVSSSRRAWISRAGTCPRSSP